MLICGCDVGASSVKMAVIEGGSENILFLHAESVRRRRAAAVVEACFAKAQGQGFAGRAFSYIAATGDTDSVSQRTGIFYGMTCHAGGARHFFPETMSVLDMGALSMRAMKLDNRGKVVAHKMTSQCASGTGQFLENIGRYLGIGREEMAELSLSSDNPRELSGICAVLAETDMINLVSRGTPLPDILRGAYDSIARRAVKLLSSFAPVESPLCLTGGLAVDAGMAAALQGALADQSMPVTLLADPRALYAGAIGAALWGARRLAKGGLR